MRPHTYSFDDAAHDRTFTHMMTTHSIVQNHMWINWGHQVFTAIQSLSGPWGSAVICCATVTFGSADHLLITCVSKVMGSHLLCYSHFLSDGGKSRLLCFIYCLVHLDGRPYALL